MPGNYHFASSHAIQAAMRALLLLLLLIPGLAAAAVSNTAATSRGTVSLISAANTADNGRLALALHFHLRPGWHVYWSNPGDAGLPPEITFDPPVAAGPFTDPPPQLLVQNAITAYVLSGDFLLPFTASGVNGGAGSVAATAHWLVCSDICVPEHARFILPLTGGASAEASWFKPPAVVASPFAARIAPDGTLSLAGLTAQRVAAAHFFPALPNQIVNGAAQPLAFSGSGLLLRLTKAAGFTGGAPLTGVLELTGADGTMQALAVSATPIAAPPLVLWLGLAVLGGLLLNLMPCVFPVLAMKALSLAGLAGGTSARIRREALVYTAGVLTAMALLAMALLVLRAAGASVGWGFQLQSPVFVAILAALILAIALNLAGVFPINVAFGNRLAAPGSFLSGLLAVAVATPCTAPFMGGAIAAALVAPPAAALGIFLALGCGLAAPFLLLALAPATARLLPRPGAWMITLQRLLAVPMFATFLWLAWVFAIQVFAAPAPNLTRATPYSAARLAALRAAGTPVFVDMTAGWCITCLVNERGALNDPAVQKTFAATGTRILVGDWTSRSPAITAYLQSNNRDGVPLYVFYPANQPPVTLPQVLTPGLVEEAVR